jgi:S-DNA-T family DNA segregation ATPase FtsK/SpoIIIE
METRRCVKFVKEVSQPSFEPALVQIKSAAGAGEGSGERDELFEEAVNVVLETKRGSVSLLQRRLTIGYGRASRLIEQMAEAGILGDYKGSQAREVNISLEEWEAMRESIRREAAGGNAAASGSEQELYYDEQDSQDDDGVPDEMPGEHRN